MSVMNLLSGSLRKPDGTAISTDDALDSKAVVGLYFSAHWCPPCRGFTPDLSKRYTALKEAGKDFELVFVSSDKTEEEFNEYHSSMTFLALPYEKRQEKAKLSKKFKVSGIPTLVFVDAKTGKLITDEGRSEITSDKFIENFPYVSAPLNLLETLGDELRKPDGSVVKTSDAVSGKVLGLYFSAHWCPPCRGFTPTLSEKYSKLKEAGKDFELVFLRSDRDEKSFAEYHHEMTFLALPYEKRKQKELLAKHFKCNGIPYLVFVDSSGKLITDEGRAGISSSSYIENFPYHPKPANDLSDSTSGINDNVSLILLMENADREKQTTISEMLTSIAEAEFKKEEPVVEKFFTGCGGGPLEQIRKGCGYAGDEFSKDPVMLLLDLGDEGAYYHPLPEQKAVTRENIMSFITAFKEETLERKTFGK
jgi:nucleoredoxin